MPVAFAAALLALNLAGSPHAPPEAPPPAARAWDDDAGDLARIGQLAARFDQAVIRRDLELLRHVERRVQEEISGELSEVRRERRRGVARRVEALERAARVFGELQARTDARSLDRKRVALAELSQAAWSELVGVAGGQDRWRAAREERREERLEERRDDRRDDQRDGRRDEEASRDEREGWRPVPPPPPAPVVQPLRADRFDGLFVAMRQEPFGEGKLRVLDAALAAPDAWLSVEQVGRLLGLFAFAEEQLQAVRRARPRLVDPAQGYQLLGRFAFDSDKEELGRILGP